MPTHAVCGGQRVRRRRVSLLLTSALPLLADHEPFAPWRNGSSHKRHTAKRPRWLPIDTNTNNRSVHVSDAAAERSHPLSVPTTTSSNLSTATLFDTTSTTTLFPFEDTYGIVRRRKRFRQRRQDSNSSSSSVELAVWTAQQKTAGCCSPNDNDTVSPNKTDSNVSSSSFVLDAYDDSLQLLSRSHWNCSAVWEEDVITTSESILRNDSETRQVSDSPALQDVHLPTSTETTPLQTQTGFLNATETLILSNETQILSIETHVSEADNTTTPESTNTTSTDNSTSDTPAETTSPSPTEVAVDTVNDRVDYASKSLGALILDASPAFQGASNLLQKDNDKYAIIPCSETSKYITIGLSEDILVKRLVLANYERYSSHMKDIRVSASSVAGGTWTAVGVFHNNGPRRFTYDLESPTWARYLKLEFLTHYGDEHYCTVTQISVYGSTMLQGFHEQWEEEETTVAARSTPDHAVAPPDEPPPLQLQPDPVEHVVFYPHWKKSTPQTDDATCPAVPFFDDMQDYGGEWIGDEVIELLGGLEPPEETVELAAETEVTSIPDETYLASEEELEASRAILSKLLQKFPSAKCLENLQVLPGKKTPHTQNQASSTSSSSNIMEPIFKKLAAEIKNAQATLTAHDVMSRTMLQCYQTILLDLLVEMETLRSEQDERMYRLETDMKAVAWMVQIRLVWERMETECAGLLALGSLVGVISLVSYWSRPKPKRKSKKKKRSKPSTVPRPDESSSSSNSLADDTVAKLVDVTNTQHVVDRIAS